MVTVNRQVVTHTLVVECDVCGERGSERCAACGVDLCFKCAEGGDTCGVLSNLGVIQWYCKDCLPDARAIKEEARGEGDQFRAEFRAKYLKRLEELWARRLAEVAK